MRLFYLVAVLVLGVFGIVTAGAVIYGPEKMMAFTENPCSVREMRVWLSYQDRIRCAQVDALTQKAGGV
jgi:hypothetical protein